MRRTQMKWIAIVVILLVSSTIIAGCFELFANPLSGFQFSSPNGIFIQAFGPNGPASWIEQERPNYCVMATAQTYGIYYGFWSPGLCPSQVDISYAMTGSDSGNASPNEFVDYMLWRFWQYN